MQKYISPDNYLLYSLWAVVGITIPLWAVVGCRADN